MNQISLYVIIALLLLNGFTGFQYFTTKNELTQVKSDLVNCQKANKTNVTTIQVKEVMKEASEESCQSWITGAREICEESCKKGDNLDSLYRDAEDRVKRLNAEKKALQMENSQLKKTIEYSSREMTDHEAAEIINYFDTVVPLTLEREQLYRSRRPDPN